MAGKNREARTHTSETPSTEEGRLAYRHSLDRDDRGVLVLWVQSRLAEHDHYTGPLDGRYDLEVAKAVRQFQGANGLTVTGVVDRKTWNAL